jgi:hypothetical protein
MKKFTIKTILFGLPILLLVTLVNYFGDAGRLFANDYENKIANIHASGKLATNISNYDERILQREIAEVLNHNPDILVLGSSRSMLIKQEFVPRNKEIYNSSVSGASIEDLISIYQMYKMKKNLPSKIILGIDPWMFNENNGQIRWKSIEEHYNLFFNKLSTKTDLYKALNIYKYKQLFSFSYFQSSLKLIPDVINGKTLPVSTNVEENETITKLLDGSIKYGNNYRLKNLEKVKQSVLEYKSRTPIYSLGGYAELSKDCISKFTSLIMDMEKQGIEIAFFLAPYHPEAYEEIKKKYPKVSESEEFIINYAKQKSYLVIGSFNPIKTQTNDSFFYDGMHLTEKGVEKIIKENNNVQQWLKQ